jgi:DNA-binding LacI/PurR family transcriptional regulator/anti-anti-sigma regulatory factor
LIGFQSHWLYDNYHSDLLIAIHKVVHTTGAKLLAFHEFSPQRHRGQATPPLADAVVDGWIANFDSQLLPYFKQSGRPLVVIGADHSAEGHDAVMADNAAGTYAATQHLIQHGHTRIGFIRANGWLEVDQRLAGYRAALAEHGLAFREEFMVDLGIVERTFEGVAAAREHLHKLASAGLPFTACLADADVTAIWVLEVFQEAGLRVPEDVAIIGFDDWEAAQHTSPPLTSLRVSRAELGQKAAQLVIARLTQPDRAAAVYPVSVGLVIRHSCGCKITMAPVSTSGTLNAEQFSRALLEALIYPRTLDAQERTEQVWPAVAAIPLAIAAIAAGDPLPLEGLRRAVQQAVALTRDYQTLRSLCDLTGELAPHYDPRAVGAPLNELLKVMDLEIIAARDQQTNHVMSYLKQHADIDYLAAERVFVTTGTSDFDLSWLQHTAVVAACLGLWSNDRQSLRVIGSFSRDTERQVAVGMSHDAAQFPPAALIELADRGAYDSHIKLFPVWSESREWGILALVLPITIDHIARFSDFGRNLMSWIRMIGAALDYQEAQRDLLEQQRVIQQAYERERALGATIRELGAPVVPLMQKVLLVPVIGTVDSERAMLLTERVLLAVSDEAAHTVLIDLTGVPVVDTQVANALIQLTRATGLLGARVILVGIRPEIAQSIVSLGIDLKGVQIYHSLAVALTALRKK